MADDNGFFPALPPFPKFASPFCPFDESVSLWDAHQNMFPMMAAYEFTGWRDETRSWKDTCYLHAGLNPTTTDRIYGKDAERFLSSVIVNTMKGFEPGRGKQAIMCDEEGYVAANGVMIRTADDEFYTYWLDPFLSYRAMVAKQQGMDFEVEQLTGRVFLFQLAGPKSLEIIEDASGEDFHDVRFLRHKTGHIAGHDIRVIRIGMAGSLAYEVHGNVEDAYDVYNALWEAGKRYGCKKLGNRAYFMNHTQGGFTQPILHFNLRGGEGYDAWCAAIGMPSVTASIIRGSMSDAEDLSFTYRTPVECGWNRVVNLDHDFVGKDAVAAELASPAKKMVTLEWNPEDILDIHRSQYTDDPYFPMDDPSEYQRPETLWQDRVEDAAGNLIGVSSGREFSQYYHQMISLAPIDIEQAVEGNEVYVVYGDAGTKQKRIRAKVSRFPYFIDGRNQDVDTATIPTLEDKAAASKYGFSYDISSKRVSIVLSGDWDEATLGAYSAALPEFVKGLDVERVSIDQAGLGVLPDGAQEAFSANVMIPELSHSRVAIVNPFAPAGEPMQIGGVTLALVATADEAEAFLA